MSIENKLYYGDNLTIMQDKIESDSIDLIYLDPPFNSKRNYNLMYKNMTGYPVPESVEAFCDTWEMDPQKDRLLKDIPLIMAKNNIDDMYIKFWGNLINALKYVNHSLMAYLIYMTARLIEMKRILKPNGSIYLHCDPTASHYIKIIMDGIFGHKNFRNEIVWCYKENDTAEKYFPKKHDIIFFYSKSNNYTFVVQRGDYTQAQIKRYNHIIDGERYANMKGKMRKLAGGAKIRDWWSDINIVQKKERLGYPTQKPIKLLERIIKASCPPDGLVFDPFCGCGTTIYASDKLKRKWIGCDIAILSIKLIKETLEHKYAIKENQQYILDGVPTSIEGARILFEKDPFQFQHWAIEYVNGFCNNKKTGDRGVDGRIYIKINEKLENMIISVKGGNIKPADVRDLIGTMQNQKSFICWAYNFKRTYKRNDTRS